VDAERFKELVSRLERQSAAGPGSYRFKVAALALLGFGILAVLLTAVGFGLALIAGFAIAVAVSGGTALLLLLKFGKLLLLLAWPLWLLVKSASKALFIRLPAPQGREIREAEAPALFAALQDMRARMRGPRFHHVLVVDEVNAAVVQRPALGLVGWPRNYLLLGLPLLESMPPQEALAVVAHEYGHLAGAHSHFAAFIYRLRHTWGTVQAYADQMQGWLGRLVAPLVRWYAPYFNAYTFVLARANEYHADAAAARLVGAEHAAHALMRVNVVAPRHRRFLERTFDRMAHDPVPPGDLMHRWAEQAARPLPSAEGERWLVEALDREGHFTDTHPTLRSRLAALQAGAESAPAPPPPLDGASAAEAWLGPLLEPLRRDLQAQWADQVQQAWSEEHARVQQQRQRLAELRALAAPSPDEQIEGLQLTVRLEPETDVRAALAAFNAEHVEHPLALWLEGVARLDHGEAEGLALLERAMATDEDATKPACERAHAFLRAQGDTAAAEAYAERWRQRDAMETLRQTQLRTLDPKHDLAPHGLPDAVVGEIHAQLLAASLSDVAHVYLARRVIPADPRAVQWLVGVQLTWWGKRRGRQSVVVNRLAAREWPVGLVFATLDGRCAVLLKKFKTIEGARLR
jgi:Zn-dependent protease with chaperone function